MAKTNGKPLPTADEAAELRLLIRQAHEAMKDLRQLHREHVELINQAVTAFNDTEKLLRADMEGIIREALGQRIEALLARDLDELGRHIVDVKDQMEIKFSAITASWLLDVTRLLEEAAATDAEPFRSMAFRLARTRLGKMAEGSKP